MNFKAVTATMKDASDKASARILIDLLVWQHKEAAIDVIHQNAELQGMRAANRAAEQVYAEANELGWGPVLPNSPERFKLVEAKLGSAKNNEKDFRQLLDFVTDKLIEKFVE